MAFKEEFEYLSFKCCYCGCFNPSRKKRQSVPKFESKLSPSRTLTSPSTDSDVSSDESSSKPIITEINEPLDIINTSNVENIPQIALEDNIDSVLPQAISCTLKDSACSTTETQDRGDSQNSSNNENINPFEKNANIFEDGDIGNPFGEYDSEDETKNIEKDTFKVDDTVKTETKED